jgi:zinc and cadmium transporter
MELLIYILGFTFLGSIGSLIGGVLLLSNRQIAGKISHYLFSFAAGVLLGTAFFDLLPEASAEAGEVNIFLWTLVGILVFFLLVRFIHFFHHHDDHPKNEPQATVPLIIIGDSVHNFIDGVAIAASFLVSIPLGILTTIAVAVHEIPQEIGDFAILLRKGMSRSRVVWTNLFSALVSFAGAILMFMLGDFLEGSLPIFLSLTAGFFIYIASSDLIPEIHKQENQKVAFLESVLLIIGAASVLIVASIIESFGLHV